MLNCHEVISNEINFKRIKNEREETNKFIIQFFSCKIQTLVSHLIRDHICKGGKLTFR